MCLKKSAYNLFMMAKMRSPNGKRQSNHLFSLHLKVYSICSMFILPIHTLCVCVYLCDQPYLFFPYHISYFQFFTQNKFSLPFLVSFIWPRNTDRSALGISSTRLRATLGVEANSLLLLFQMVVCWIIRVTWNASKMAQIK